MFLKRAAIWPGVCLLFGWAGSLPVQASELFQPGGYLKFNTSLSDYGQPGRSLSDQMFVASGIPLKDGRTYTRQQKSTHAKESRFWLRSTLPEQLGTGRILVEYDLFDSADGHRPRLRHLYGSWALGSGDSVLIGQAYSAFANVAALADTDAATALGNIVIRQPMLRWTRDVEQDRVQWMLSLEESESRIVVPGRTGLQIKREDDVPDVIVKRQSWHNWGSVSVAGMVRQIRNERTGQTDNSSWGGALSIGSVIQTGRLHNVRLMASAGNALGRYIGGAVPDGYADINGALQLQPAYSATAAYQHFWTEQWRSTVAAGFTRAQLPSGTPVSVMREARSLHANLMWTPIPRVTMTAEYLHAFRSIRDGTHGELNRLHLSLRLNLL